MASDPRMYGRLWRLPLMLSLFACASVKTAEHADVNIITSAQVDSTNAETAYDLILKRRPNFLHSRGQNSILIKVSKEPSVFLDNVEYGTLASLRSIPAATIAEVRFFEGWDAMTKYGTNHVAGVIQIYTRYQ